MTLREQLEVLYPGNKVYGPYVSNQDGRSRMTFRQTGSDNRTFQGSKSFTMSLARAKMTVKEGRILEDHEEVDHLDEDNTNDSDDNLQILHKSVHDHKSASEVFDRRNEKPLVACPCCGDHFFCDKYRLKVAQDKGREPCCSRHCSSSLYTRNQYMEKSISGR